MYAYAYTIIDRFSKRILVVLLLRLLRARSVRHLLQRVPAGTPRSGVRNSIMKFRLTRSPREHGGRGFFFYTKQCPGYIIIIHTATYEKKKIITIIINTGNPCGRMSYLNISYVYIRIDKVRGKCKKKKKRRGRRPIRVRLYYK